MKRAIRTAAALMVLAALYTIKGIVRVACFLLAIFVLLVISATTDGGVK